MVGTRAYLDCNATTPLRPSAHAALVDALGRVGNASSVHGEGREARRIVEEARSKVANVVNAPIDGVVFTASATEAAHLALSPNISSDGTPRPAGTLYVLATEHPCVLAGGRFAPDRIKTIPVNENGLVDETAFAEFLEAHDDRDGVPFVAIQLVNSETGVVQPVARIAQAVRFRGGYVLCDAVQAFGRMPIDLPALGVDFLLLSSHKAGGPQGAAALICAHDILQIEPAIRGGGQEKNRRAGTENVAAIAGFGAAAEDAARDAGDFGRITALRDSMERAMFPICGRLGLLDQFWIAGAEAPRVGNTTLLCLEGLDAQTALIAFDLDGVAVSSGSACSSGKVGGSHVLEAMGVAPALAKGAVRVSLGWHSDEEDCDRFIAAFERLASGLAKKRAKYGQVNTHGAA